MKEVELKPGWLKRQMDAAKAEVATWPKAFLPLLSINEELRRKAADAPANTKVSKSV